jgi:Kef-type K+ transport system membrane component KefB
MPAALRIEVRLAPLMAGRRLTIFYVVLIAAVAVVATLVLTAGASEEAEPPIAGGYDVSKGNECLGDAFDLRQSGQFVSLQRADGSGAGKLRFENGKLMGDVSCLKGGKQPFDGTVDDGAVAGTVGDADLAAEFAREPPDPGAQKPAPPGAIAGEYKLVPRSACLGGKIELTGTSKALELESKGAHGELTYGDAGKVAGTVTCAGGDEGEVTGAASLRDMTLTIVREQPPEGAPPSEKVVAQKIREFGHLLAAFFIAVALVMLAARLMGQLAARVGQPRVMGEVLAGILLGPTLFGALLPDVQRAVFPPDVIPFIGAAANLGLIFYMFLVGLEIDTKQLKGRISQTAAISNTGVAIPMIAGLAVALPVYELVGPDSGFTAFALFMGVSMSITAFPVLARILVERRMLKKPIGVIALTSAAIDDISAWFLIALATAVAVAGSGGEVVRTIALAAVFVGVMVFGTRKLLARASTAFDEAGRVPGVWIVAIFAGVLLSAYATEQIGIALIFGAFVMGAVMPRHAGLTEDVTHRMEDFVVLLLLPLFFCFTGLRTNVLLIDRTELLLLTLVLTVVAIACKFGGSLLAARVTGLGWRESAVIGTLMNTRGLTELIVLNLALEKGVISEALFAMLVIMALVTTFMAGPLLNLLDPKNEYGTPLGEELEEARKESQEISTIPIPERAILVAPQTPEALPQLVSLTEPLARSTPPRELILARLVRPPRGASARGGLQTEEFALRAAAAEVAAERSRLLGEQVAARAVAFTSSAAGADLVKLAQDEAVDLLVLDGRRPLLGGGVPRGDIGHVLEKALCDVAVLVASESVAVRPGTDAPILVPFGGAEHDWAALELAAWLSSSTGAPLKLLGSAGQTDEDRDASRLLGNASMLVQRFVGVLAEPVITEPGRDAIAAAAGGAGLLVVGLSDRWRQEGLGPTRSELASSAPAPILFVRRGERAGALAPREDVTRFTWSSPAIGTVSQVPPTSTM